MFLYCGRRENATKMKHVVWASVIYITRPTINVTVVNRSALIDNH